MKKHQDKIEAPYDGIVELDNVLPPWWLALFIITILWSMVYLEGYHLFKAWDLQEEEYRSEMKLAEEKARLASQKQNGATAPKAGKLPTDAENLTIGKEIYAKNCASCHAPAGGGLIGPNLVDSFWIHGGSDEAIIKVIEDGVLEKGMLPWKQTLKPREILAVGGYIRSLQGTNPPNAKEPQGEEYLGGGENAEKQDSPQKQESLQKQTLEPAKAGRMLPSDPENLALGKDLYMRNCSACHAPSGGGTIGPNLADRFWIHGGSDEAIIKVIEDGVLEKGMVPWKQTLKPKEILAVGGYIRSLQDTNPPNAKEPQGEEYNP